jgi:hypothetical protein
MRRATLVLAALAAVLAAAPAGAQSVQGKTHLGGKASALVSLGGTAAPGQVSDLILQTSDGSATVQFELPPGTALVVTDVVATTNGAVAAGTTRGGLVNGAMPDTINPYFSFTSPAETHHSIHLTGGALWTVVPSVANVAGSANSVFVSVHGYLVKDK